MGYTPFMVPEAATLVMQTGFKLKDMPHVTQVRFQSRIMRVQLSLEQHFAAEAEEELAHGKPILVLDRGAPDCFGYMDAATAEAVTSELGVKREDLLKRYSAAIHLRTVAFGAEEFYTLENNGERVENTLEAARKTDESTLQAWNGHEHLHIIDNSKEGGFEHKMHRVKRAIAHTLGIPEPLEIERKYIIDWNEFPGDFPVPTVSMLITQTYVGKRGIERVRMVEMGTRRTYTHTLKTDTDRPGVRIEKERDLNAEQYREHLSHADKRRRTIRKTRRTFIWENQYFELDEFLDELSGLFLLEIELTDLQQEVKLPPFIPVMADVTEDSNYTNAALARIK